MDVSPWSFSEVMRHQARRAKMTELDVTLTDYFLAVECALFAYLICRQKNCERLFRFWFSLFFGSLSFASLTGGTVHGFFLNEASLGYRILWPLTLIFIGITAFTAWMIGSILFFSKAAKEVLVLAGLTLILYCVIILAVNQTFTVAIVYYLPSAVFLFIALLGLYRRVQTKEVFMGLFGLGLTFFAVVIQQSKIGLHPLYFNYNALYHLIQAVGLFMIFYCAQWLIASKQRIKK
jgi:hypothetical protein